MRAAACCSGGEMGKGSSLCQAAETLGNLRKFGWPGP